MALNPPWEIQRAMHIVGVDWPTIDEDQLRLIATDIRAFSSGLRGSSISTSNILADASCVLTSEAFGALVEHWADLHGQHLNELLEVADSIAQGFDIVADTVVAVKWTLIVYFTGVAAELVAGAAATVATGGAGAFVETGLAYVARREGREILRRIELDVVNELLNAVLGPLIREVEDRTDQIVKKVDKAITVDVEGLVASASDQARAGGGGW